MRMSKTFVKTLREAPKGEEARNAQLLIRAGYVHKEMAGVYDYLPLGLRVIENIKQVIREELNRIGAEEILMSTLQKPEPWRESGRWDENEVDIWFKTELSGGGELGLAPTHEEPVTELLKTYVSSYKDLPRAVYQFQTKFRNELRAKSGILRGREFLMKDLYSFHQTEEDLDRFYEQVEGAYAKIFERLGIGDDTFETFASGGIFTKYSHEYQTLIPVGEDTVFYDEKKKVFLNKEVYNEEVLKDLNISKETKFLETAGAEVGNIFKLKFKYSEPLGLNFQTREGEKKTVYMGCYGIGVSRVFGVIVERYADEKGLVLPEEIAPYKYYLVANGELGTKKAMELYEKYQGDKIILDDRDVRFGEKMKDAELMGIPIRVVISDRGLDRGEVEVTERMTGETKIIKIEELMLK